MANRHSGGPDRKVGKMDDDDDDFVIEVPMEARQAIGKKIMARLEAEERERAQASSEEADLGSLQVKIDSLSALPLLYADTDWARQFAENWDVSIPLAVSVKQGLVSGLTDEGAEAINECFTELARTLGKTEQELLELQKSSGDA